MRGYIKRISIILAAIIAFSCAPKVFASGAADKSGDGKAAAYAVGLGIIEEYNADKEVTVGELKRAAEVLSKGTSLPQYIIKDKKDDNAVSFIKVLDIFAELSGYKNYYLMKNNNTITENGLFALGIESGLIEKVPNNTAAIKMCDFVSMIYNLMDMKTLETVYKSNGGTEIEIGNTRFMNKYLDMYEVHGIVDAVSFTALRPGAETRGAEISIDGIAYHAEKSKYEDFIGRKVDALIKNDDGRLTVCALYDRSSVFFVDAEDIAAGALKKSEIAYYNSSDRTVTLKLDERADVIYNFSLLENYSAADFDITQGRLVLIDNDNDGKYEVVKIEEYKTMMLFSFSIENKMISDVYGKSENIAELIENDFPIYDQGNLITPENIPVDRVATYYLNKANRVVRIFMSKAEEAGTIESFRESDNTVTLEGKKWRYSEQIKAEIESMKIGDLISVWLDYYGNIAYAELSQEKYLYGYMVSFDEGDEFENPRLKVYTEDNEFVVYKTKSRINLNGKQVNACDAFAYNLTSGLWDQVGKVNQLIKYKANKDNVISTIITSTNSSANIPDAPKKEKEGVFTYYSQPKTICSDIRLNQRTKVFLVPQDLSYVKRFRYGIYQLLANDTEYTCKIFDVDENRYAGVIVARITNYDNTSVDELNGRVYIIDETGTYQSDDGTELPYVTGLMADSTPFEIKFDRDDIVNSVGTDSVNVKELKRGDAISIPKYNGVNQYSDFRIWYINGKTEPYENAKRSWYSDTSEKTFISDAQTYCYGTVEKVLKNGFLVNNQPQTKENRENWNRIISVTGTTPVMICDNRRDLLYKATVGEIQNGDNVFMVLKNAIPTEIVIYRD